MKLTRHGQQRQVAASPKLKRCPHVTRQLTSAILLPCRCMALNGDSVSFSSDAATASLAPVQCRANQYQPSAHTSTAPEINPPRTNYRFLNDTQRKTRKLSKPARRKKLVAMAQLSLFRCWPAAFIVGWSGSENNAPIDQSVMPFINAADPDVETCDGMAETYQQSSLCHFQSRR